MVVQRAHLGSFWSGTIGDLERISIESMENLGHSLDIYSYEPDELSSQVETFNGNVKNANDVLPLTAELRDCFP